tara:strand:- start:5606 stop:6046 length:441 start_codon:yes stop_codon:yes gene_type:complete
MSKLNKNKRRLKRPKFFFPQNTGGAGTETVAAGAGGGTGGGTGGGAGASTKGAGLGKAAGILGLVGSAIGIASQLKKKKKKKVVKPIEPPVAGRVQKPMLSKKMKHKKPKLMGRGGGGKGLSISPGAIAALGGLAYLFFGNKKKSK